MYGFLISFWWGISYAEAIGNLCDEILVLIWYTTRAKSVVVWLIKLLYCLSSNARLITSTIVVRVWVALLVLEYWIQWVNDEFLFLWTVFLSFNNSVPACYVSDVVLVQSAILDNVRDEKGLCYMSVVDLWICEILFNTLKKWSRCVPSIGRVQAFF